MNKDSMEAVHAARNHLLTLKGLIHFYMQGEKRFTAEAELEEVAKNLNVLYASCLKCDDSDRRES